MGTIALLLDGHKSPVACRNNLSPAREPDLERSGHTSGNASASQENVNRAPSRSPSRQTAVAFSRS